MQSTSDAPLNPLQLELLKSFSLQTVDDNDLRQIRMLLSQYFARKAATEAQKVADEMGWSPEQIDDLAQQHYRTPYNPQKPF